MPMKPAHARQSSFVLTQALLFTAIGLAGMLGCALVLIGVARATIHADLLHTVDTDIAGLVDVAAGGGTAELRRRIADRIALDPARGDRPLYLLVESGGARIGNIAALPALDVVHSASGDVPLGADRAVMRATRLHGGAVLVVGRSLAPQERLAARLWRMFGWAAIALTLASLLIGGLIAGRLGRRVAALNMVFERFDRGDLSARIGPRLPGDEIARLGGHVDRHLGKIEQLLQAQREISDNIAHELLTPLVHLDARLLRALESAPTPEVTAELDAARADIRSVVSLFDGLLDIALAEAGTDASPPTAPIDLSEIAADVAELYAASAEEAGIEFVLRIAPGVMLRGEPMQLTRMVANLLDNAFKYAPSGSRVRLVVAPGPQLIVEDNGPGVPAGEHERIFQRFSRASAPGPGHGLGLALVRVIAARHGLFARVEDAAPGARFVIETVR